MFTSRLFAALRNTAFGLLVGASALGAARAAVVNVSASQSSVVLGGSFSLHFQISGLSAGARLGGFDLDLSFDNAVLAFSGHSFVDNASGQNQLDLPELGSLGFTGDATATGGVVDVFAVSGNSEATLASDQADDFRFLTLNFSTLAVSPGSALSVDLGDVNLIFFDAAGFDLGYTFGSSSATVAITGPTGGGNVPEPGALGLVLAALAGVALARPRRRTGVGHRPATVVAH